MSGERPEIRFRASDRTSKALDDVARLEGHTKSDTINRAIQFYAWACFERQAGNRFVVEQLGQFFEIDWHTRGKPVGHER